MKKKATNKNERNQEHIIRLASKFPDLFLNIIQRVVETPVNVGILVDDSLNGV